MSGFGAAHASDPRTADLLRLAGEVRAFLEPRWGEWFAERGRAVPPVPSTGMCRFAAFFLRAVLDESVPGDWAVVGGSDEEVDLPDLDRRLGRPGGCRGGAGWQAHYWVVDESSDLVVDVAADQFGHPAVVVADAPDGWRANFHPGALEEHRKGVRDRVARWLGEWREARAVLRHVTDRRNLPAIASEGLRAPSWWGLDPEVVEYYVETLRGEGGDPVVLAVPLSSLDPNCLGPDLPSLHEPVVGSKAHREKIARYATEGMDWRRSLALVGSLRCDAVVPFESCLVEDVPDVRYGTGIKEAL